MNAVELKIEGMTCGSCVARVRNALMRVDGVAASMSTWPGGAPPCVHPTKTCRPTNWWPHWLQ